ncbi:succinate dehydrogenase/fumarate reductase cytochrome b subunit, b558 family [Desulfosporosinus acidiphilus SJ4]|uniref:Succinate dehydrogenase/fumarate reductase cytochrome b subunit, b558 family n=1 Tax=Desulfosporosinus acidiphilus (strain DSM 22704 / JCM 16185 / SJ4) TaxID=646529 RepID=I4D095_DESAJ|nr:succinate dehydrogenase cytochrome b558 subunit [Desulfosporosinus acidiphilus]AFM39219.1 succinate dehydrogenase/fumarate reductase cytochrome b subunit, b558 family [Desulfosporosinus acidiphilus SJ4]
MSTPQKPYHFLIRRVHSLLGLVPIGLFLIFHMFLNLSARGGPEMYDKVIGTMRHFPGIIIVELVVIFIPIFLHAVYGIWVVYTGQSNILSYNYARNWFYLIQRISGIYTVIFIVTHVFLLRFGEASFAAIHQFISNPLGLIFYALGVLFAIFHFVNGLWAFAITWGITIGPHSQKVLSYVLALVFVIISAVGLADLSAFL